MFAIRLIGDQNPVPASHSATIDHIAMTTPPAMPASAPRLSVCVFTTVFIAASSTAVSDDVRNNSRDGVEPAGTVSDMTQDAGAGPR